MATREKNRRVKLPGEPSDEAKVARMLRVDHAGEFGAKQIYAGQLAVLKGARSEKTIRHMAAQEEEHLAAFEKLLNVRKVRPTALTPLWRVGGFALGAVSAAMGEKAAMACTVAVEDEIADHYGRQLEEMPAGEEKLAKFIKKTREDEIGHRDTGLHHGAEEAPGYRMLYGAVRKVCRVAIKVAERV